MQRKLVWSFSEHSGSVRTFDAYLPGPLLKHCPVFTQQTGPVAPGVNQGRRSH